ncbi:MAG: hypothetical protein CMJ83_18945 [Planctomycetes bacterium]|nr:hypothetical protein [Planctomycetota bacterium]
MVASAAEWPFMRSGRRRRLGTEPDLQVIVFLMIIWGAVGALTIGILTADGHGWEAKVSLKGLMHITVAEATVIAVVLAGLAVFLQWKLHPQKQRLRERRRERKESFDHDVPDRTPGTEW